MGSAQDPGIAIYENGWCEHYNLLDWAELISGTQTANKTLLGDPCDTYCI